MWRDGCVAGDRCRRRRVAGEATSRKQKLRHDVCRGLGSASDKITRGRCSTLSETGEG